MHIWGFALSAADYRKIALASEAREGEPTNALAAAAAGESGEHPSATSTVAFARTCQEG